MPTQRQEISASIQSNFPDNTSQFITPARLRSEQGLFENYAVLNEQTASIIAEAVTSASVGAGSVTTASFNAYTASTNAFTSSIQTQVNALQAATSSYVPNAATSSMSITTLNVSQSFTASGLIYPTADGLVDQVLQTNGAGILSFENVDTILEAVQAGENITKGDPLYISGSSGANPIVYRADAADANKMPVTYIAYETLSAGATGRAIILGLIEGMNLTGYNAGDEVYVAAGGGWTSTRPTGSAIIQFLGIVTKPGAGGKGLVLNPGPATLPNLTSGYVWVGDANGQPVAVSTSSITPSPNTGSFATTGSNTFNGTNTFTGSVNIQTASIDILIANTIVSSSTIFSSGSNILGDASNDTQTLWGTVDIKTGPLQVSGSTDISGSLVVNGSSVVLSNQTSSFATSAITASSLVTASVALNTITFTKGDASTFAVTVDTGSGASAFPFTGSAQISGSLTIENPADTTVFNLTQGGNSAYAIIQGGGFDTTLRIPVNATHNFSGSGNNIYRFDSPLILAQPTTVNSASLFLYSSGSTGPLFTNFTQSNSQTQNYGNILMFALTPFSASVIFSGSRNIGTVASFNNALALTTRGGGYFNGNIGSVLAAGYSTASSAPTLTNNMLVSSVTNNLINTTSSININTNFVGGPITITGSGPSSVSVNSNNIDTVVIENSWTGSGANQTVTVQNSIIKAPTGASQALIKFASTGSSTNSRIFGSNILFGANLTASLEASGTGGNLFNTALIGAGLIVSGTQANPSLSASMFVGQFNETGSFADPSLIKFAVGAGTSNTARKTALFVSRSGDIVISAAGGGETARGNSVFGVNYVKIGQNTVNANTTVAAYNGSFMTNGGTIAGGEGNILLGGGTNTITAGRDTAMLGSSYSTINTLSGGAESHNVIVGAQSSVISGSRSRFTGIYSSNNSSISQSIQSAIIAGNFTSLNDTTSSVALGRDTAYTGSASYTLYTQNIQSSGSVEITGSATITGNAVITGSLSVNSTATFNDVIVLPFQNPLPSGKPTGSVALSGSGATYVGMFVYDGTNWVTA